jgi:hypothetical protein
MRNNDISIYFYATNYAQVNYSGERNRRYSCYAYFVAWRKDVQGEVWDLKDVDIPDAHTKDAGGGAVVWGWAAVFCLLGLLSS